MVIVIWKITSLRQPTHTYIPNHSYLEAHVSLQRASLNCRRDPDYPGGNPNHTHPISSKVCILNRSVFLNLKTCSILNGYGAPFVENQRQEDAYETVSQWTACLSCPLPKQKPENALLIGRPTECVRKIKAKIQNLYSICVISFLRSRWNDLVLSLNWGCVIPDAGKKNNNVQSL